MSRSQLYFFLLALCAGVALAERYVVSIVMLGGCAACGIVCTSWTKSRRVGYVLLALSLGLFRCTLASTIGSNDIARFIGQTTTIRGTVVLPPAIVGSVQRVELTDLTIGRPVTGKLMVTAPVIPAIQAGTSVSVACQVEGLKESSRRRLWSHGIHAACSVPASTTVGWDSSWRSRLGRWQERILQFVRKNYNEPQASLLNGILVGNTSGMPDRYNEAFQATGTTHIVALSGFNVTIIMALLVGWLVNVVGRRTAWLPALIVLVGFVVMSGASASVVRAAVMACIVQVGIFLGRPIAIGRLLAYTAIGMVMSNPLMLYHDLGFQLSFLATLGLVVVARPLAQRLTWIPERWSFRESLATTVAAIMVTEPLLLWRFGRLSVIAPVVNMLVLPVVPIVMASGAVSLLGIGIPVIGTITVPMTDALLRFILFIISQAATWPGAVVQFDTWLSAVVAALCVMLVSPYFVRHEETTIHPA